MENDHDKLKPIDIVLAVVYVIAIATVLMDLFIWRPN